MPIYCYKCTSCGEKVEVLQKRSDCSNRECPDCGGIMEKIMSPVGIIFKGSGFHVTDYKRDSKCTRTDEKQNGEKPKDLLTDKGSGKDETKSDKGTGKEAAKAAPEKDTSGKSSQKNKKEVA